MRLKIERVFGGGGVRVCGCLCSTTKQSTGAAGVAQRPATKFKSIDRSDYLNNIGRKGKQVDQMRDCGWLDLDCSFSFPPLAQLIEALSSSNDTGSGLNWGVSYGVTFGFYSHNSIAICRLIRSKNKQKQHTINPKPLGAT